MNDLKIGDTVAVTRTGHGYQMYEGMVGTVTRTFDVPGHGQKVVIEYPPQVSRHTGGTFTPHPFETFADRVKAR